MTRTRLSIQSLPLLLLLLLPIGLSAQSADTIRVCSYNLEEFSVDVARSSDLLSILSLIDPTILLVQGIGVSSDLSAFPLFRSSVSDELPTPLTGFSFFDPKDEFQVGILWDSTKLEFIPDPGKIDSDPVVHAWMRLVVRTTGDTLVVVTGEWAEGDTLKARERRSETATLVRETVDLLDNGIRDEEGQPLMVLAGSFNMRGSHADAYGILTNETESGGGLRLYDPANRPGPWSSDSNYAAVHTYNTRVQVEGGDTTGGLNDRFDQIFLTGGLLGRVIPGSYSVFGNDGHLFRKGVSAESNSAVIPLVALSLERASDHLPVYLDLVFGGTSSVENAPVEEIELDITVRE